MASAHGDTSGDTSGGAPPEPEAGAGRSVGARIVRVLVLAALAVLVLYLLFFHIFPWVEQNFQNPSLEGRAPSTVVAAAVTGGA